MEAKGSYIWEPPQHMQTLLSVVDDKVLFEAFKVIGIEGGTQGEFCLAVVLIAETIQ